MNITFRWVLGSSVALVACACTDGTTAQVNFRRVKPAGTDHGAVVAKFANDAVTEGELVQRFAEMNPYARTRFQTIDARRDYVEGLARFELLAQEAVRQGVANDPEVIAAAKRVMVQQLLKRELEDRLEAITDAQVATYYEAHKSDYVKPAMTRLSHISFAKDKRAEAEAVLKEALALPPNDFTGFGKLAREHSDEARTKPLDGDMRFLSDDELAKQYGAELVAAAASLPQVGTVAPQLVETEKALHIIKLQGRQVALNLNVDQAKPSIQQLLLNTSKQQRFKELVERLKKQAKYEVNDEALAAIKLDVKAPAVEAKSPQPGYLPAPVTAEEK